MRKLTLIALAISMAASAGAFAQDAGTTVNSTSTSNVQSGAMSSSANEGNAQNITFNSPPQPSHTKQTLRTAPSMAIGSFGTSFSSDNCSNTTAAAVTVVGFGASGGKAVLEQNCAHIRRGFAFGQAAAFAAANHQTDMASKLEAMVNYEFCTADGTDSDTANACVALGLIAVEGKKAKAVAQERQQAPSNLPPQGPATAEVEGARQNALPPGVTNNWWAKPTNVGTK